jgi:hypothetical protein
MQHGSVPVDKSLPADIPTDMFGVKQNNSCGGSEAGREKAVL